MIPTANRVVGNFSIVKSIFHISSTTLTSTTIRLTGTLVNVIKNSVNGRFKSANVHLHNLYFIIFSIKAAKVNN